MDEPCGRKIATVAANVLNSYFLVIHIRTVYHFFLDKFFEIILKKQAIPLTCHCSSCWLRSTFCWIDSISWLLACMSSTLVLANSTSTFVLLCTAASLSSLALTTTSSWASEESEASWRALSLSSRAAASSTSQTEAWETKISCQFYGIF